MRKIQREKQDRIKSRIKRGEKKQRMKREEKEKERKRRRRRGDKLGGDTQRTEANTFEQDTIPVNAFARAILRNSD